MSAFSITISGQYIFQITIDIYLLIAIVSQPTDT